MIGARARLGILLAFALGSGSVALLQSPRRPSARAPGWEETLVEPGVPVEVGEHLPAGPLEPAVAAVAARYNLDPALVLAVIQVESGFDPELVSPKGALGLMQVLPDTAALLGLPEPGNAATSLEAGCRYLAALLEEFGGDAELALAAYNAGPGAVRRWGGIPPYRETREFVRRVSERYRSQTGLDMPIAIRLTSDAAALF